MQQEEAPGAAADPMIQAKKGGGRFQNYVYLLKGHFGVI